ncbi:protein ORF152 [Cyprinid herpesvirus 2]|uniref:Uncharacterized protein n=1 Tax=Cyprinid herpesvirus 2 TaxID=317878 RepID=A0A0E3X926_CYHV2|nr:hypothetical protein [Cyprinid herpesvirus 2]QAU54872.1 protein ORF152 [Cyprinid herpesvirus 2]
MRNLDSLNATYRRSFRSRNPFKMPLLGGNKPVHSEPPNRPPPPSFTERYNEWAKSQCHPAHVEVMWMCDSVKVELAEFGLDLWELGRWMMKHVWCLHDLYRDLFPGVLEHKPNIVRPVSERLDRTLVRVLTEYVRCENTATNEEEDDELESKKCLGPPVYMTECERIIGRPTVTDKYRAETARLPMTLASMGSAILLACIRTKVGERWPEDTLEQMIAFMGKPFFYGRWGSGLNVCEAVWSDNWTNKAFMLSMFTLKPGTTLPQIMTGYVGRVSDFQPDLTKTPLDAYLPRALNSDAHFKWYTYKGNARRVVRGRDHLPDQWSDGAWLTVFAGLYANKRRTCSILDACIEDLEDGLVDFFKYKHMDNRKPMDSFLGDSVDKNPLMWGRFFLPADGPRSPASLRTNLCDLEWITTGQPCATVSVPSISTVRHIGGTHVHLIRVGYAMQLLSIMGVLVRWKDLMSMRPVRWNTLNQLADMLNGVVQAVVLHTKTQIAMDGEYASHADITETRSALEKQYGIPCVATWTPSNDNSSLVCTVRRYVA